MTNRQTALLVGAALACAVVVGAFGARYAFSLLFNGGTIPNACLSQQWEDIPNVAGLRFQVEYMNCDTLAKDEAVSVYVLETQQGAGDKNRRTLVFRYDPGGIQNQVPKITASGNHKVLISVPEVSSITAQRRNWGEVDIDYNIGHVTRP